MPSHQERVRQNYPEERILTDRGIPPAVWLDIRAVLDFCEHEYLTADLQAACRRLRRVVGYGN